MTTFSGVDPAGFLLPVGYTGRGAWTHDGIGFSWRYEVAPVMDERIGKHAELSLSNWATSAGVWAIQRRLINTGFLSVDYTVERRGIFNVDTQTAVKKFQTHNVDPAGSKKLDVDGTVGTSDVRALFTPLIDVAEVTYNIPGHRLRGETMHESALDPGAVGGSVYNGPAFMGVDRGVSQINSLQNAQVTWTQAYDVGFSLNWSAQRLRAKFDSLKKLHPKTSDAVLWDAAILNHNNPSDADKYAAGEVVSSTSLKYIADAAAAIY
jgi:peptidoglycan hydrolase-like protein with peptidoglycan-binding domain